MKETVQNLLKMQKCPGDRGRPDGYELVESEHPVLKHYFLDAELVNKVQRVWRTIEPEDLPLVLIGKHPALLYLRNLHFFDARSSLNLIKEAAQVFLSR